jgi:hypothetical protein
MILEWWENNMKKGGKIGVVYGQEPFMKAKELKGVRPSARSEKRLLKKMAKKAGIVLDDEMLNQIHALRIRGSL